MLPRLEPSIRSSVQSKALSGAMLEDIVPASSCTLKAKRRGGPSQVFSRTPAPTSLPRLAYITVAWGLGKGKSGGKIVPAPEMRATLRLVTRTPARPRIGRR